MSCDACARMQESTIPTAQGWLVETRSPARLRPLGRPAVVVQFYCCSLCGTNWLSESDPLGSGTAEWVCLYNASSVLAPVSTLPALRVRLLSKRVSTTTHPQQSCHVIASARHAASSRLCGLRGDPILVNSGSGADLPHYDCEMP